MPPTLNVNTILFVIPCDYWGDYRFKILQLLSLTKWIFIKFHSSMTIFTHKLLAREGRDGGTHSTSMTIFVILFIISAARKLSFRHKIPYDIGCCLVMYIKKILVHDSIVVNFFLIWCNWYYKNIFSLILMLPKSKHTYFLIFQKSKLFYFKIILVFKIKDCNPIINKSEYSLRVV